MVLHSSSSASLPARVPFGNDVRPAVPDVFGRIQAARVWVMFGGRLLPLVGPVPGKFGQYHTLPAKRFDGWPWGDSEPQEASCNRKRHASMIERKIAPRHRQSEVPEVDCFCGFWGYKSAPDLMNRLGWLQWSDRIQVVWGVVNMWGRVCVGPRGYRAQYAQIDSFVDLEGHNLGGRQAGATPWLGFLARNYDVPVMNGWPHDLLIEGEPDGDRRAT